jgi:hypothetical protein
MAILRNSDGVLGEVPDDQVPAALQQGYAPAPPDAAAAFLAERHKRETYGTTGQQIATALEGAGEGLTFGGSDFVERALGVDPEGIKARAEVNPATHIGSTLVGAAAPLLLSGGEAAPAEAGVLGSLARAAPSSLVARAGQAVTRALAPEGAGVLRTLATKGAGAAVEGGLYGAGDVARDVALGDDVTPASAAQRVALSAGLGGVLGGGLGAAELAGGKALGLAKEKLGVSSFPEWLKEFEGERNIKAAGAIQSDIRRAREQLSREEVTKIGREGGELGLVTPFSTPAQTFERSEALQKAAGDEMGNILRAADAKATPETLPSVENVIENLRKTTLKDLKGDLHQKAAAERFEGLLNDYEDEYAGRFETNRLKATRAGMPAEDAAKYEGKTTLSDLHDIRRKISKELYGWKGTLDPSASAYKDALHDFRAAVSDELEAAVDRTSSASDAWKAANRKYQVATKFMDWAQKGIDRATGNNLIPLTTLLGGIGGGSLAGPAGALASGLGSYAVRQFGSGVLGAGARVIRERLEGVHLPAALPDSLANAGYARNAVVQLAGANASDSANHGIGAVAPEMALGRPPAEIGEAAAPLAMKNLLGDDPGGGKTLLHEVGSAVSPRLVEALGDIQAKAYASALGAKDDAEARRLLREAGKLGYGGPFTSASELEQRALHGLVRAKDEKARADTVAIVDLARAAQRANVDRKLVPITAEAVEAAWSHGPLAGHGAEVLREVRAHYGKDVAAALAPSLRKAVKGPQPGLVPPSEFHEEQAQTRSGMNEALAELGAAPREGASPEQVASLAVLARRAEETASGITDAAAAFVAGKAPAHLRAKPLSPAETLKMMDAVRRLASDPEGLADALDHHTATLGDHAPQTGQAAALTLSRGAQYLASCLPDAPPPSLQHPKGGQPARSALASWSRKADAVLHPVETLASGGSPEAAEAIQAVYPSLWGQWRASAVLALAEAAADGKPPSFQTVQRVSNMIGQPLVPAQQPAMLAVQPTPPQQRRAMPRTDHGAVQVGQTLRTGTQQAMVGGRDR